jgi:hypothetical protein
MRRLPALLASLIAVAAASAEAARVRVPVLRPAAAPTLAMPGASLAPAPSILPSLNAADALNAPSIYDPVLQSELTAEQIESIEKNAARGVESAEAFLKEEPLEKGGYVLGISGEGRHAEFAEATGLTPFNEAYIELFGRPYPVRTPEFLEALTDSGETVVFLVPPKALTHEKAKVTKEELEWLFDNPERMKSIRFVFGAYDLPEVKRPFPVADDALRVAQKRRHEGARGSRFVEVDPEALTVEFERGFRDARNFRERASRGVLAFQGEAGTFVTRRIQRGYFLEMFPADGGPRREAFVSKRKNARLFARIAALAE